MPTETNNHRLRHAAATFQLRNEIRDVLGFESPVDFIEKYVTRTEEIMSALSDQIDAATAVITTLEANQVDPAAQASLVKLAAAVASANAAMTPATAVPAPQTSTGTTV